ncbi:MAG: PAS domain-containing sensor histidine kinase [Cucumibacter sp.]
MPEPVEKLLSPRRLFIWRDVSAHPDNLRRSTLRLNAVIALVLTALLLPVALPILSLGVAFPAITALFVMLTAAGSLAFYRDDRVELITAVQIASFLVVGTVFSLAHPNFADFGVATVLLAPIYAGYVARLRLKRVSWGATTLILGFIITIQFSMSPASLPARESWIEWLSVITFLAAGCMVALTGWRFSEAFTRFERSQIRAFQHLVENVQDAVVRYAANGEMLFISRSAETLFGCRRYQLVGAGFLERIHVLDRPAYLRALDEARHHGFARVVEIRVRSDLEHANSFFWIEVSLSPIQDPRAKTEGHEVVAVLRDVTVRKDYEEEIRRAQHAAEAASQTKSRFLATIGHELRTPLNAIVGFTDMMLHQIGGRLSPNHEEYARLILQSGQHLLDMVTMLLDMSKIEAGKFELQTDSFNPTSLIEPCVVMMDRPARERGVTIKCDIAPDLPAMVGDERACRQVLINLLSNAIKFSPSGTVVEVRMRVVGTSISICVADHGIGIAPADVARIGEPFFQANTGLDRRYEGAGLGLSIIRGLVELHDGELKVASRLGAGTTVTVLLPIGGPVLGRDMPADAGQTPISKSA